MYIRRYQHAALPLRSDVMSSVTSSGRVWGKRLKAYGRSFLRHGEALAILGDIQSQQWGLCTSAQAKVCGVDTAWLQRSVWPIRTWQLKQ